MGQESPLSMESWTRAAEDSKQWTTGCLPGKKEGQMGNQGSVTAQAGSPPHTEWVSCPGESGWGHYCVPLCALVIPSALWGSFPMVPSLPLFFVCSHCFCLEYLPASFSFVVFKAQSMCHLPPEAF